MKLTQKKLKQIIFEEHQKLKKEGLLKEGIHDDYMNRSTYGGRSPGYKMALPKMYSSRVQAARRGNQLPPEDSNWYQFAKALDIGVLDLDELAYDLGFKTFDDLDASISPRGISPAQADEIVDIMFGMNGADEIEVLDALGM